MTGASVTARVIVGVRVIVAVPAESQDDAEKYYRGLGLDGLVSRGYRDRTPREWICDIGDATPGDLRRIADVLEGATP